MSFPAGLEIVYVFVDINTPLIRHALYRLTRETPVMSNDSFEKCTSDLVQMFSKDPFCSFFSFYIRKVNKVISKEWTDFIYHYFLLFQIYICVSCVFIQISNYKYMYRHACRYKDQMENKKRTVKNWNEEHERWKYDNCHV